VGIIFNRDSVLREFGGMLVVTFTVICTLPFMYFLIKNEENKEAVITKSGKLLKEHSKAILALLWMFMGFVVAFGFWYIVTPQFNEVAFNAQIKIYCMINSPSSFSSCILNNGLGNVTGNVTKETIFMNIFANNIYVLMFTIFFSLIFGAGAIFILAWNASVIGAAIGMFAKGSLSNFPISVARYMIHGIPEIAAYFVGALAGGIVSVAVIRRDLRGERMWRLIQDALLLIVVAIMILVFAGLMEVYITPKLF
jgi:uncharacterized membrane protein SpoIIM required for sporulation